MEHISYKTQTEIVNFQGREIPLENLTPILSPEQLSLIHISEPTRRSRRRRSAGSWSSGSTRCSASTNRRKRPPRDFFR